VISVRELLVAALLVLGAIFMLLAAVGLARMPDVLLRMSACTKSVTLGAGCMLLGAIIYFEDLSITTRALSAILFLVTTAPVAAHKIARAAYVSRVRLWEGMRIDELRDGPSPDRSGDPEPPP
jgi:multicomponent Na+:H+ antiporter subunit G